MVDALAQLLVAYTVHVDTVVEDVVSDRPHPWLTSLPMWSNLLRFVDPGGTPLDGLPHGLVNLGGLRRWGYVEVRDDVVHLRRGGVLMQEVWSRVVERVEAAWSWLDLSDLPAADGPHHLPVVGYGLRTRVTVPAMPAPDGTVAARIAHALMPVLEAYEARSEVSLPIAANVLRVLDGPTPIAGIPSATGLSREAIEMSVGWLERHGYATTTSGRGRAISLNGRGDAERRDHDELLAEVGSGLPDLADQVRRPEVVRALTPRGGWRSRPPYASQTDRFLADPATALPRWPAVTHRGGFPDGS